MTNWETCTHLNEVSLRCGAESSQQCARAFVGNDLAEAADEALVVLDRVELKARLDHVDGS